MRANFGTASVLLIASVISPAARLNPPAERAFDQYIRDVERRLARQHEGTAGYLALETGVSPLKADVGRELRSGGVEIEPVNGGSWPVNGGLLHHWRAAACVPGARAQHLLRLLRDYDRFSRYYAPDVLSARALGVDGDSARIAMRFRKKQVVTVVLDTEFEIRSGLAAGGRGYSISRSTHIWQVDQVGSPRERRRAEGEDDGFLWRLNSYWSFRESPDGLLMECEAVSLTRDIPLGLGWLVTPIIQTLPRSSLEFTMTATRNALAELSSGRHDDDRIK